MTSKEPVHHKVNRICFSIATTVNVGCVFCNRHPLTLAQPSNCAHADFYIHFKIDNNLPAFLTGV